MIQIGDVTIDLNDPQVQLAIGVATLVLLVLVLLVMAVRRAGRSAEMILPLAQNLQALGQRVEGLNEGQQQLAGGLTQVSEATSASQANLLKLME